ncbi:putative hydrolase [Bacillus sp. TS-2]|nr:putative hydrolase [Bacillus sp. TS-2]
MERKSIKLVALDMDGTLLNTSHEVSVENQRAIREAREQGVEVILCTGRSLNTSSKYAKSLELNSYHITVNGSEIWGPTGEILERVTLETSDIETFFELMNTYKTGYWAVTEKQVWNGELPENIHEHTWLKFGFNFDDEITRDQLLEDIHSKGTYEISNSHPLNIEVNVLGINKANAIKKVCEKLQISMDEVLTCGDSLNDLAMIKEAGVGVAMGNAQEIVKKEANWITATNNEDGVAKAIDKFVLNK